jgi:hypothetical protein
VKDGRYEEQKFRMKSSGLVYLYYLIEDYTRTIWQGARLSPHAIDQVLLFYFTGLVLSDRGLYQDHLAGGWPLTPRY